VSPTVLASPKQKSVFMKINCWVFPNRGIFAFSWIFYVQLIRSALYDKQNMVCGYSFNAKSIFIVFLWIFLSEKIPRFFVLVKPMSIGFLRSLDLFIYVVLGNDFFVLPQMDFLGWTWLSFLGNKNIFVKFGYLRWEWWILF
jgi:hypothetical protein